MVQGFLFMTLIDISVADKEDIIRWQYSMESNVYYTALVALRIETIWRFIVLFMSTR